MWLSSKVWKMEVDSFMFNTIWYPLLEWQYITVIKRGCGAWCLNSLTRRKKDFPIKINYFYFFVRWPTSRAHVLQKNGANCNVYFFNCKIFFQIEFYFIIPLTGCICSLVDFPKPNLYHNFKILWIAGNFFLWV